MSYRSSKYDIPDIYISKLVENVKSYVLSQQNIHAFGTIEHFSVVSGNCKMVLLLIYIFHLTAVWNGSGAGFTAGNHHGDSDVHGNPLAISFEFCLLIQATNTGQSELQCLVCQINEPITSTYSGCPILSDDNTCE